jgi:hypothetical protein
MLALAEHRHSVVEIMSGSGNPSGDENDLDLKEQDRFLPIAK